MSDFRAERTFSSSPPRTTSLFHRPLRHHGLKMIILCIRRMRLVFLRIPTRHHPRNFGSEQSKISSCLFSCLLNSHFSGIPRTLLTSLPSFLSTSRRGMLVFQVNLHSHAYEDTSLISKVVVGDKEATDSVESFKLLNQVRFIANNWQLA